MVILRDINKVDKRHTVDIQNGITASRATQLNEDGSYEDITYMIDDVRTYSNEAIIDATEEELEAYRKFRRRFQKGDRIQINRGRKMKGEIKIIKDMFTYNPAGTYGHNNIDYLVFEDGTKVNKTHCDFI